MIEPTCSLCHAEIAEGRWLCPTCENVMYPENGWRIKFRASWLCLRERAGGKKAEVVRVAPSAFVGSKLVRIYDAFRADDNGKIIETEPIYVAAEEFKVGQILDVP